MLNIRNIDEAIEVLYRLNVGVIGSGEDRRERRAWDDHRKREIPRARRAAG